MSNIKSIEDAHKLYMQINTFAGVEREVIGGYPVAESASQMPYMSDMEFAELQQSIFESGLQEKIKLNHNDEIVDGRHRMLACLSQDVDPEFCYTDLGDAETVDIYNLRRRNLTPGQRASLYLKLTGEATAEIDELPEPDSDTEALLDLALNPPASADAAPAPAPPAKPQKSTAEQAREAGVSERTMRQAKNVARNAIPEVADAAIKGELPIHEAEQIARKPPEQQRAELESRAPAKKRARPTEATFDLTAWARSIEGRISKILASVPQSMRDTCHRRMGELLGATVRMERETPDLLNAEGVVPYVEQLVKEMPKSERAGAEKALSEHFGSVVTIKESSAAIARITAIVEGLPAAEKKKAVATLGETYAAPQKTKPAEYLPALPAEPEAACDVVVKELRTRTEQLSAVEGLDATPLFEQTKKTNKKLPRKPNGMES